MNLSIITIRANGTPAVLRNDMAECETLDDWRRCARENMCANPAGTVVWLMEEDGEYPLFRYMDGQEEDWTSTRVLDRIEATQRRITDIIEHRLIPSALDPDAALREARDCLEDCKLTLQSHRIISTRLD